MTATTSNQASDSTVALPGEIIDAYTTLVPLYSEGEGVGDWVFGDFIMREITPSMKTGLDVGCGVGRTVMHLAEQIPTMTGIDITPAMIEEAQRRAKNRPGVDFVVGDIQTYQFPHNFDFICAMYSLGYVDRASAFRKLYGMLNPGGKLVVIDGLTSVGVLSQPILGMAVEAVSYYASRVRFGLGLNLRDFVQNSSRVDALYKHSAWKVCKGFHKTHGITPDEYRALIKDTVPTAKLHLLSPFTAFVVAAKP